MKKALFALVLATAPAAAQPVTRPDACGPTIAYAPDDVRTVVEAAIRQETSCNVTLEVRIVPTDGGLYLFARDEQGRVRERLVPDSESAAVLVASWMVDDSRPPAPPPIAVFPKHRPARVQVDAPREHLDAAPSPQPMRKRGVVIGVGPMFGNADGGRVEVDALSWHGVQFGGGVSIGAGQTIVETQSDRSDGLYGPWHDLDVVDTSATAHVAVNFRFGDWLLRPAFGLGFTYSHISDSMETDPSSPSYSSLDGGAVLSTTEFSFALGRRFGDWQVDIGPHVAWLGRGPNGMQRFPNSNLFAALRYSL